MKKKLLITGLALLGVVAAVGLVIFVPNPLGNKITEWTHAKGYIPYSPKEAKELAYKRCSTCHSIEKILEKCPKCDPPFIVLTQDAKKHINSHNAMNKNPKIKQLTDAEIVAIVQVWNGLVGNWESVWRKEDIQKFLGDDQVLLKLLDTPIEQRMIEMAMKKEKSPKGLHKH